MASFLPPVLTAQSVSQLIAGLDQAFYPTPSPGFTARIALLWSLNGACIILSLFYLWLHVKSSTETPRRRCLWLMRLVARADGRLIALNIRPTWVIVVLFYSTFNIVFLGFFYSVYELGDGQRALIGLREYNAIVLFIGGWLMTWANMSAFLLVVDREQPYLAPRRANILFIGFGLFLVLGMAGVDTYTTILGLRLYDRYSALRTALVALNEKLDGRVPTLLDFLPLSGLASAFGAAADAQHIPSVVQLSLINLFPLSILLVNLGGAALVVRLRRQIKENRGTLAQGQPVGQHEKSPAAVVVQLPLALAGSNASSYSGASDLEAQHPSSVSMGESSKSPSSSNDTRRPPCPPAHAGGSAAARAQARKILSLEKAANDMQAITMTIAGMCLCLMAMASWGAYCAATDKLSSGQWPYTEGTLLPPQWIYTVALFFATVIVIINALRSSRRIADLDVVPPAQTHAAAPTLERKFPAAAGSARPTALTTQAESWSPRSAGQHSPVVEIKVDAPSTTDPSARAGESGSDAAHDTL
ncbi:hypothetical protein JCM8208_003524 [Rhodotorula glutinis]